MTVIPSQLDRWQEKTDKLSTKLDQTKARYADAHADLSTAQEKVQTVEEAQSIAQTIAQDIQQQVHSRISSVVSRCLSAVFPDPYKLVIRFDRKRGRTEAVLLFERDGNETNPMDGAGGGPVDLAAFALRLSSMMLSRPKLQRTVVMDEPFKSPSPHYRKLIRDLLASLSDELGVQFIFSTNIMELVCGEVIDLEEE